MEVTTSRIWLAARLHRSCQRSNYNATSIVAPNPANGSSTML